MADSPISGLPAASAGQTTDLYVIVDTTDTSQAPTGTDKKLTGTQLLAFAASGAGNLIFTGNWDASTNTPTLASGVGISGNIFVVSVAGTFALDGITQWNVGDWAVFDGITDTWVKVLGSVTGVLLAANNLSDVASTSTSRTNLGLGTAAVDNIGTTVVSVSNALEQASPNHSVTGTNYTYLSTDRGKTVIRSNATAAMTDTLPQATGAFGAGWFVWIMNNDASANITITPTTSTINGASSFVLTAGSTTRIMSDGTNYFAFVGSSSTAGVTSFNTRTGAVTLSSADVTSALTYVPLSPANNLSDVSNPATARTNLGLGTSAVDNTGNTVVAVSGALEQASPANPEIMTSYTYLSADRAKTVVRSNTGVTMTDTLAQATGTFGNGWFVWVKNSDATASVIITPTTSTINGTSTLTIPAGFMSRIVSDGTNYQAFVSSSTSVGVTSFNTRTGAVTLTSGDVTTALMYTPLNPANNLSDVANTGTARTNLGLGTAAVANLGNTVISISGGLEVNSPANIQVTTSYTILNTDRGKTIMRSNAGSAMNDTLPQAIGLFNSGWFTWIYNADATASLTITPTISTINGSSTLVLTPGQMTRISSNGTNYVALISNAGASGVTSFNTRTGIVTLLSGDVTSALGYTPLNPGNNLSDLTSISTARTNLGLGTAAVDNTGNTVVSVSGALEQASPNNTQTTTSYTYLSTDRGKTVIRANGGASMTDTLPQATGTFGAGWFVWIDNNDATASITITPTTSTINGSATYVITAKNTTRIVSDGTNYFAFTSSASGSGAGVTSFNTRTGAVTLTSGDVTIALGYTPLNPANNLSDVANAATSRTNLGLGTAAVDNTGNTVVTVSGALEISSPHNTQTGTSYTYVTADRGKTVLRSNSGAAMTDTLPQATGTFGDGWTTWIYNADATASITITPTTSTINGAATLVISPKSMTRINSDGTNYEALVSSSGGGVTSFNTRTGAVTLTSLDVTNALTYIPLNPANNLSDVASAATSRTNLGLGTAAVDNTGNTVVAVSGALEQATPHNTQTGASYAYVTGDRGKTVIRSNSGSAMSDIIPQATTTFGDGWFVWIANTDATAALTLTPTTSTINGAATLVVPAASSARVSSDGTNYEAFVASSSTLAPGNTVVSISGLLEQASPNNTQSGASYTYLSTDRGKTVIRNHAGTMTDTLPQATGSFGSGWFTWVTNQSASSTLTITPTTSTINGAASLSIGAKAMTRISSDGTNYEALNTIASGAVTSFNTRTGAVTLTNADVSNAAESATTFSLTIGRSTSGSISGNFNTMVGDSAGAALTSGTNNSGFGAGALQSIVTGSSACAFGLNALTAATGGGDCAFGSGALSTTTGSTQSCAFGFNALASMTAGMTGNAAFGFQSGSSIGTNAGGGTSNTCIGANSDAIAIGGSATNAIAIGSGTKAGGNCTYIGTNLNNSATTLANNTAVGFNISLTGGTSTFSIALGSGAAITAGNQFVVGSSTAGQGMTLSSTVGAAGGASLLPATPLTYWTVRVNGVDRKIPLYNT